MIAPANVSRGRPRRGVIAVVAILVLLVGGSVATLLVRRAISSSHTGVLHGSGIAVTQSRTVTDFRAVDLAGANDVTIEIGARQSVLVHGDDNLVRYVTTRVKSGTLVIKDTRSYVSNTVMRVTITMPSLRLLKLSGSGTIRASRVDSPRLAVSLSGSGIVRARGVATTLSVALGGSGEVELFGLVARDVQAGITGSGQIRVTATRTLRASVPGSGQIVYRGNPGHVLKSITGSGAITKSA